ncbi:MAG: hypothetical protein WC966_07460 [Bradymonadales bacterium]|jgi:hypothetical protein
MLHKKLKELDLSILQISLPPSHKPDRLSAMHPFWWRASLESMPLSLRKSIDSVNIEKTICLDHSTFSAKVIEKIEDKLAAEPSPFPIPPQVDNQLAECTPQFSLRNIPKVERYYDLSRKPPFDIEELPLKELSQAIAEVHAAHIEPVEFIDFNSSGIITDFRVFIEEILYLCPWNEISRTAPPSESLWHISQSRAQLAKHLLDQKNSLYTYSYTGTHKIPAID